ncbi:MAG: hypothetical protein K0Q61_1663, partial [Rhodococcus erythropolis]|nr:hypothetical protein [Rhodococcus erythropolis]
MQANVPSIDPGTAHTWKHLSGNMIPNKAETTRPPYGGGLAPS